MTSFNVNLNWPYMLDISIPLFLLVSITSHIGSCTEDNLLFGKCNVSIFSEDLNCHFKVTFVKGLNSRSHFISRLS